MVTSRFLKACRQEPVHATPIWFMRQAGRYMPEYRALREQYSLLDICRTPDLAAEVTLQPIRRLEVDAAILFSDLLLPLEPMGLPFDFIKGEGPQIERPIESPADIDRLRTFEPRIALAHVLEAIGLVQRELAGRVPLIGFVGAPFTLASYAIEGGHSNNFARTKSLMYGHPEAWHRLCARLATMAADYLTAQIDAGVDAVQVFDSWVGALGSADYREFVLPHTKHVFQAVGGRVPTLHFGTGTSALLAELREAGGDVIGVDWRIPLEPGVATCRPRPRGSGQPRSHPLARAAPPHVQSHRRHPRPRRRPGRSYFQPGPRHPPSTPVEHVQMLAQYVHHASRRTP